MRVAIVLLAVVLTACGCGKKEAPRGESKTSLPHGCNEVRIVSVSGNDTLMETNDSRKIRFIREGNFGSAGEVFALCN